jgi:hypothetical protein
MPDGRPQFPDLRARIGHFRQKPVDMVRGADPKNAQNRPFLSLIL